MSRIVGIDLGTTNSLVAIMDGDRPRVIADPESGNPILPSVVALMPDGEVAAGDRAIAMEPHLTVERGGRVSPVGLAGGEAGAVIRSVKRYMGLGGAEVAPEDRQRYTFADFSAPVVRFQVGSRVWTPPQISAVILRALKNRAEAALGETFDRAVITVPAYFNDGQRQATKDAGRLAGLEVVRLVNEPTAASLAYGLNRETEGKVAVYDFGGGTFDISILNIKGGIFEVLATNGDTHLGGDDLDLMLVNLLLEGVAEEARRDRHLWNSARSVAEDAKKRLSIEDAVEMKLPMAGGHEIRRIVTREEFERLSDMTIARTLERCRMAMRDAGLEPRDIDAIVLVGGSTRMPLVRRRVAELFGREPLCSLDPDQVVALGAAVQAGVLMGGRSELLLDVVPLSLGIEAMGGVMERLIHRSTTIPTSVSEMFTTAVDNQTHVDVHVLQGERELAADCRSLARFKLGPLQAMPAGLPRVEVTFLIDANGILNVTARDQRTGREHSVDVKPSYGLDDEEIERLLEESIDLGEQDLEQRMLIAARVGADQILTALHKQLAEYSDLIGSEERSRIEECAAKLREMALGMEHALISDQVEELNKLTTPFAERIMDNAIKQALERKSVSEL